MSKPYTEDDLAQQLSQDLAWRIREMSDLKSAISSTDSVARASLLRATVAICYAHWEGHVRFSARKFLTHVSLRRLPFAVLQRQFLKNNFLPTLAAISQKSLQERGDLIDHVLDSGEQKYSRVNEELINTKSNLNSTVLGEICYVCCIERAKFDSKRDFIDILLLRRRNSIAHGEDTLVSVSDIDDLISETITIMRLFSNEIGNSAYLHTYRVDQ